MFEKALSEQDFAQLQADLLAITDVTKQDRNALINAAGGLDSLLTVLDAPNGFKSAELDGRRANHASAAAPVVLSFWNEEFLNTQPVSNDFWSSDYGKPMHPYYDVHQIGSWFPEFAAQAAGQAKRHWKFPPTYGAKTREIMRQFPEFITSDAGKLAVKQLVEPVLPVLEISKVFPTKESFLQEASVVHHMLGSPDLYDSRTPAGTRSAAVELWGRLLRQDPEISEQLPRISALVASRLGNLGIQGGDVQLPDPNTIRWFNFFGTTKDLQWGLLGTLKGIKTILETPKHAAALEASPS